MPENWQIKYNELTFNIKPMGFKHTGLFPEQAVNWEWMINKIKSSGRKDIKVLNLFAYTGGATVADVKLMYDTVNPTCLVKASGGVRTAEDFANMKAVGASRIGTSNGIQIMKDASNVGE